MKQQISPAVGAVIAIVIVVVIGLLSMKKFGAPEGVQGKIPASAANPNGGGPPMPMGVPGAPGGPASVGR